MGPPPGGQQAFASCIRRMYELLPFWYAFFTKLGFSIVTIAGMLASFYLLSQAMKTLPLGTAYAVWTGIGAVGSVVVGILIFKEPVTAARMFFTVLLLAGIIGIKLTAAH